MIWYIHQAIAFGELSVPTNESFKKRAVDFEHVYYWNAYWYILDIISQTSMENNASHGVFWHRAQISPQNRFLLQKGVWISTFDRAFGVTVYGSSLENMIGSCEAEIDRKWMNFFLKLFAIWYWRSMESLVV